MECSRQKLKVRIGFKQKGSCKSASIFNFQHCYIFFSHAVEFRRLWVPSSMTADRDCPFSNHRYVWPRPLNSDIMIRPPSHAETAVFAFWQLLSQCHWTFPTCKGIILGSWVICHQAYAQHWFTEGDIKLFITWTSFYQAASEINENHTPD